MSSKCWSMVSPMYSSSSSCVLTMLFLPDGLRPLAAIATVKKRRAHGRGVAGPLKAADARPDRQREEKGGLAQGPVPALIRRLAAPTYGSRELSCEHPGRDQQLDRQDDCKEGWCCLVTGFHAACSIGLERRTLHSMSGRRSSQRTAPLVAFSISGQCSAGTRRTPFAHWLTSTELLSPIFAAKPVWVSLPLERY
jgi:hypothetical protein